MLREPLKNFKEFKQMYASTVKFMQQHGSYDNLGKLEADENIVVTISEVIGDSGCVYGTFDSSFRIELMQTGGNPRKVIFDRP